jgi:hypothetical protein
MHVNLESEFYFNLSKALCAEETRARLYAGSLVTVDGDVDKCVAIMRVQLSVVCVVV